MTQDPSAKPLDDGGPAFPVEGWEKALNPGMSLRDYFAAHALEIILKHGTESFPRFKDVAEECWRFADAMIATRTRRTP